MLLRATGGCCDIVAMDEKEPVIVYQEFDMIPEQTIAMSPKVTIPFSEVRAHIRADASLKVDRAKF